jgi:putative PIN family toxin of toxin-antitoxin system
MIPLRLVVDTNIVVSAALKPEGLQRTVLLLALTRPAHLYITPQILEEYQNVLRRPELKIRRALSQQFLDYIRRRARLVKPVALPAVTPDADDLKFLECADAARADYLVTGNLRHFPAFWKTTKIVASREFIRLVSPHLLG